MPKVLITNSQRKKKLNLAKISRTTSKILNALGGKKAEVSISFVTNRAIAGINKKYLSSRLPTDVLAFPLMPKAPPYLLGDVVISVEKASSQAKKYKEPFEKELIRLVIHGILHLTGYKDKIKSDRIRMHKMQEKILSDIYEAA